MTNAPAYETRDHHGAVLALEFAFGVPFEALLAEARAGGAMDVDGLLRLGDTLLSDLAAVYRGDLKAATIRRPLSG